MHERHQDIADAEGHAARIEGGRDGQGDDQKSAHAEQEQQPQRWLAWRHGIGEPRIPAVDPPQVAEDQQGATEAQHGWRAGQNAGELGDGEDEDQIEEQLDGQDPGLRRARPAGLRLVASHAAALSGASPSR